MKQKISSKIDPNSKKLKYFEAKKLGKSKKESAIIAGFTPSIANNTAIIENTNEYRAIESHFKDEMLAKTTISEVSDELLKVVRQDKELGAKVKAIEMAKNWIEPDSNIKDEEQVVIVLKS